MQPDTRFVRADDVPTAEFGDELAVMDLRHGTYIAFNSTAAAVWKLLDEPRTLDSICDLLVAKYRVDPARCRAEITDLLDKLGEMKVVIATEA